MTARLATHPDVAVRAPDTLSQMISAGVDVELVADSSGSLPDPLRALRESSIDLALVGVQALRGPAADGLTMLAVFRREDPRDALVVGRGAPTPLRELPAATRVAISDRRRLSFLRAHRADLEVVTVDASDLLPRLAEGREVDAAVTGAWEARTAGLASATGEVLDPRSWLPAPGQGAVALLARHPIAEVTALDHLPTRTALRAELALLDALDAPADAALGCLAQPSGRLLRLWAGVGSPDGRRLVRADLTGPLDEPEVLGTSVARELAKRGAGTVLGERGP